MCYVVLFMETRWPVRELSVLDSLLSAAVGSSLALSRACANVVSVLQRLPTKPARPGKLPRPLRYTLNIYRIMPPDVFSPCDGPRTERIWAGRAAINLHEGHYNGNSEEGLAAEHLLGDPSPDDCSRNFAF